MSDCRYCEPFVGIWNGTTGVIRWHRPECRYVKNSLHAYGRSVRLPDSYYDLHCKVCKPEEDR